MLTRLLLLLAPCLAYASSSSPSVTEHDIYVDTTPQHAEIRVSCQELEASFRFSLDLFSHIICGQSELRINGEIVGQESRGSGWTRSLQGQHNVVAQDLITNTDHNLSLTTNTQCLAQAWPEGESGPIEFTSVRILAVDGHISETLGGFSFASNPASQRIIRGLSFLELIPSIPEMESDEASPTPAMFHSTEETNILSVQDEINKLQQLEESLAQLQSLVDEQKKVVYQVAHDEMKRAKEQLGQCESVSCFAKTLLLQAKNCVHVLYLHLRPDSLPVETEDDETVSACLPPSLISRAKILVTSGNICPTKHQRLVQLHTSNQTFSVETIEAPTVDSRSTPTSSRNLKIYAAIAALSSLLTLTLVASLLHTRCCSSLRVRADRAAAREERRTQKAYRRAARRQAIRNFVSRYILRIPMAPRHTGDYDEKRAIIVAQEAVLEAVMQGEMRQLAAAYGVDDVEAGAGKAMSGRAPRSLRREDGLPGYGSRGSSSTRPPSYHQFDESMAGAVVEAFLGHNSGPNFSGEKTREKEEEGRAGEDATPDSSVVDLSPRQSSETLRTQFSAV